MKESILNEDSDSDQKKKYQTHFVVEFIEKNILTKEVLQKWLVSNRGCFAVVQILEVFEALGADFSGKLKDYQKVVKGVLRHLGKKADKSTKGYSVLESKLK